MTNFSAEPAVLDDISTPGLEDNILVEEEAHRPSGDSLGLSWKPSEDFPSDLVYDQVELQLGPAWPGPVGEDPATEAGQHRAV